MRLSHFQYSGLLLLGFMLSLFVNACKPEHTAEEALGPSIAPEGKGGEDSIARVKHLMETGQVEQMYDKGQAFKVIEISKSNRYRAGHLPGAINFWRAHYEGKGYEYGGMRASPDEMAALLGRNGISPEDFLVIYDTRGSVDAIRFMWILDMYGHEKMAVMNGGKAAWKANGFELTTEATVLEPVQYTFGKPPDYSTMAKLEDIVMAMSDTNYVLLDTREPEEYQGLPYISKGVCYPYKEGAFTYGRIPGSVHLNWSDAVDLNGDHRFKALKDLRYNFKRAGITADKKIIAYCQSGVRSAHTAYVLTEILGFENVKNYDGSWIEWSYNYMKGRSIAIARDIDDEEHKKQFAKLEAELIQTTPRKEYSTDHEKTQE